MSFVHGKNLLLRAGSSTVSGRCLSTFQKSTSLMTDIIAGHKTGGIGLQNVRERVIPSVQQKNKLYKHTADPRTCTIIGVPMTYGQPYVGTDHSPVLLREAGLRSMLSALHWRVEDLPDLDIDAAVQTYKHSGNVISDAQYTGRAKNHLQVGLGSRLLAEVVLEKLQAGRFPLILGGDHSIGIGSLAAILKNRPDTGVLWIDAHADLNIPRISESGNMHGMPVGMMMEGLQTEVIPGLEWLLSEEGLKNYPRLKPDSIVYVGLRDVDPEERKLIRDMGIHAYTMSDIDHFGIGHVMDMALDHLLKDNKDRPLHLSYDIDAVDPVLAPATGTAVRGGLTFREAHYVAEAAVMSGNLASAEIVELNPSLSQDQGASDTVELGLQLITSMMGKSII